MRTADLDYPLPPDRIATHPVEPRDAARLMVVHRDTGRVEHRHVRDLPDLGVLQPGDLMVVNETRVLPAAFEATRRRTGGRVRGLYLRSDDSDDSEEAASTWRVMLEARGTLRPGEWLDLDEHTALQLIEPIDRGEWRVRCTTGEPVHAVLQRVGQTPLPPYILKARRAHDQPERDRTDPDRYNTIYARTPGSVAAPTAGLHFTPELLARLEALGVQRASVTLHVGAGTFAPVRTDDLAQHQMHEEWVHVPAATIEALQRTRDAGRRIFVIGTTSVRALESLPDPLSRVTGDFTTNTSLFIHPDADFRFRFTDLLMTNFHLPRSTLIAMVATLPGVGLDRLKQWYQLAVDQHYRFYSYGDAMLFA